MIIQVNSDKTIAVDASLTRFVKSEVNRILERFTTRLTRVEVHLSDIDNKKSGKSDKRCLIEARPAGSRPLSTSADAAKLPISASQALRKMQRLLTTFFDKTGKSAPKPPAKKEAPAKKVVVKKVAAKKAPAKKTAVKAEKPKKKIYQARRKSWPAR